MEQLVMSRLILEQEQELQKILVSIDSVIDPQAAQSYYFNLQRGGFGIAFPNPYSPQNFVSLILNASKKNQSLFSEFVMLIEPSAQNQETFKSFIKLRDSLVCLQELENKLLSLKGIEVDIEENKKVDTYLNGVYTKLVNVYAGLPNVDQKKVSDPELEFMKMFNAIAIAEIQPDSNRKMQPLITFIKEIEDIFPKIQKPELQETIWTTTKRFLTLRHGIEDREIQLYRDQFDEERKSAERQSLAPKGEHFRDAVLFSVRRKATSKLTRYHVTVCKWDGTFHSPVELKNELKKNELEKCITSYLSKLAQNSDISTKAIIEFFLPSELLNLSVDQWKIEEEEGTPQTLGFLYCVLVRCQKRLMTDSGKSNKRIQERVKNRWECLNSSFKSEEKKRIRWVDPNEIELTDLVADEYNCTGFTTVINEENIKRLEALSTSAIPVALWTRKQVPLPSDSDNSNEIENRMALRSFFEERLETSTMSNVNELMKAVLVLRQKPDSGEIRKHISLFWDDPNRYIPQAIAQSP